VVLIEYLTFGRRHIAKQVAQQIAQRAAFLVDQAIQEKVSGAGSFLLVSAMRTSRLTHATQSSHSNLSSSVLKEKPDQPN
jgi:hypothetical protein